MAENFLDKQMRENIELAGRAGNSNTDIAPKKSAFFRDELSRQNLEPYEENNMLYDALVKNNPEFSYQLQQLEELRRNFYNYLHNGNIKND